MFSGDHPRLQYGVEIKWASLPAHTSSLTGLSKNITALRFRREKNSHRGLREFQELGLLVAFCLNQEALDEIAQLPKLEFLYIQQTTAFDLSPLAQCRSLRHLIIKGGTKVPDFAWVTKLPPLKSLLVENFKRAEDLAPMAGLESLDALEIEGSMWTTQKIQTFEPIASLNNLRALFLSNCRARADGLYPIHALANLRYLETAAFYPDAEFLALNKALPLLECQWFQDIARYGNIRAAIKARTSQTML